MKLSLIHQLWENDEHDLALSQLGRLIEESPTELSLHLLSTKWLLQINRKSEALRQLSEAWKHTREVRVADLLSELAPTLAAEFQEQSEADRIIIHRLGKVLKTLTKDTGLKIDVLNSNIFGVQALEARYLSLGKQAGYLDTETPPTIYVTAKPVNKALAQMQERELPLFIDEELPPISNFCRYNWKACEYQLDIERYREEFFGRHADLFGDWIELTGGNTGLNLIQQHNVPDEFLKGKSAIEFTDEEQACGEKFLHQTFNSWNPDQWFVCVFARDGSYYNETPESANWFRNAKVESFVPAIESIIERGGHVIRIGAKVDHELRIDHPQFFDYSASELRSPLLDLYLIAHAKFFVGTPSGLCHAALLFDTPQLNVNTVNLINDSSVNLYIPKKVTDLKGKIIPYGLYLDHFYHSGTVAEFWENGTSQRLKLGIEYVDNTPEEIRDATIEMMLRLEDKYKDSGLANTARRSLRRILEERKAHLHDPRVINTQIAGSFLEQNPDLFLTHVKTSLEPSSPLKRPSLQKEIITHDG